MGVESKLHIEVKQCSFDDRCCLFFDIYVMSLHLRDSHFMIGEEFEPKPDEQEKPVEDTTP